jgi:formamidopyrimidine-DNA glycosylase
MPELPEVERTVQSLRPKLIGASISDVVVTDPRVVKNVPAPRLRGLAGQQVEEISRRGKYILLRFSGPVSLVLHLRMAGKLVLRNPEDMPPYSRLQLRTGTMDLHLVDPRALVTVEVVESDRMEEHPAVARLGLEPLSAALTARRLHELLARLDRPVKGALMDQRLLAGIGNIQATEALWHAGIGPARRAGDLGLAECGRLVEGIRWTLNESLARERGPEIRYVSEAKATNPFVVYRREGTPCPRCKTTLVRSVIAGRGTVSCTRCQPDVAPEQKEI